MDYNYCNLASDFENQRITMLVSICSIGFK
jgi:hypothetical protein